MIELGMVGGGVVALVAWVVFTAMRNARRNAYFASKTDVLPWWAR